MTPYQTNKTVTTTVPNQIVPIPIPGRCLLDQIVVVLIGGGVVSSKYYSRAFTGPAIPIYLITSDGSNTPKCALVLSRPVAYSVGDAVTVSGSPHAGYNTTHRIVTRVDDQHYVTDQAYVTDALDGPVGTQTIALDIPSEEWPIYSVTPDIDGTDTANDQPGLAFANQDPLPNLNIGVNRLIYVQLATVGTYRLSFRTQENVGW